MANSKTKSLVSIDVGGTNARFALAEVNDGKVVTVAEPTTFATGSVAGLAAAGGVVQLSEFQSQYGNVVELDHGKGLVTRYVSSLDFDVAGQRVTTTATTVYEGGSAADLVLGANVEVEGGFAANASLVAARIEFRRESDVELSALVDHYRPDEMMITGMMHDQLRFRLPA